MHALHFFFYTCTHQDIMGGGVPAQDAHTLGVALQFDDGLRERRGQPAVWDLPNLFTKKQKRKDT